MARILICGTLAYDDIGEFSSPVRDGIRNVKLDRLDHSFGGCAMNIAYNLAGLGHEPVPFVYAGDDYSGPYAHHVARSGISEAGIFRINGTPSARGIILTGSDGAQFTAFYPGPSGLDRYEQDLEQVAASQPLEAAVIAPDLPQKMAGCAAGLAAVQSANRSGGLGTHVTPLRWRLWCPGQYAELLDAAVLMPLLQACNLLLVNRHEWLALCRHLPDSDIAAAAGQVVITDGPNAVELLPARTHVPVPPLPAASQIDPTGCGDAFAAAMISRLVEHGDLRDAVADGIRLAGRCLACRGAQSHAVNV
jgi:adenosine kinase